MSTKNSQIRQLRKALGLSSADLGRMVGKSGGTVRYLEKAEVAGSASLASLKELANAMGHEVAFQILPKISVEKQLEQKASERAKHLVSRIANTMSLEQQGLEHSQLEEIEQMVLGKFLANPKLLQK